MNKTLLIGASLIIATSGCVLTSNEPDSIDFRTRPETRGNIESFPQLRVNFLARYMIDDQTRKQITNKAFNTDLKSYSKAFWSPTASMTGDLISGTNGSMLGVGLSLGFVVAEHLMDGAHDNVSGFLIPSTYKGQEVSTEELAIVTLVEMTENRLEQVAKHMNWSVKCLEGCDENSNRLYEFLDSSGVSPLSEEIIYKPEKIYAWLNFNFKVRKVEGEEKEALDAFTNQDIRWKNQKITGYSLYFIEPHSFNTDDSPILTDYLWPKQATQLHHYRIGREMLRMYHNDGLSFTGTKDGVQDKVFFGGNMYVMDDLFSEYVTEPPAFDYEVETISKD